MLCEWLTNAVDLLLRRRDGRLPIRTFLTHRGDPPEREHDQDGDLEVGWCSLAPPADAPVEDYGGGTEYLVR